MGVLRVQPSKFRIRTFLDETPKVRIAVQQLAQLALFLMAMCTKLNSEELWTVFQRLVIFSSFVIHALYKHHKCERKIQDLTRTLKENKLKFASQWSETSLPKSSSKDTARSTDSSTTARQQSVIQKVDESKDTRIHKDTSRSSPLQLRGLLRARSRSLDIVRIRVAYHQEAHDRYNGTAAKASELYSYSFGWNSQGISKDPSTSMKQISTSKRSSDSTVSWERRTFWNDDVKRKWQLIIERSKNKYARLAKLKEMELQKLQERERARKAESLRRRATIARIKAQNRKILKKHKGMTLQAYEGRNNEIVLPAVRVKPIAYVAPLLQGSAPSSGEGPVLSATQRKVEHNAEIGKDYNLSVEVDGPKSLLLKKVKVRKRLEEQSKAETCRDLKGPIGHEKKGNDNQSLEESRPNKIKTTIKPSVPVNKPRMDSITLHKRGLEANVGDVLQNVVRKTPGPPVSHGGGENPLLPSSKSSKISKSDMKRSKRRLMKNFENNLLSKNKAVQPESVVTKPVPFGTLKTNDATKQRENRPKPLNFVVGCSKSLLLKRMKVRKLLEERSRAETRRDHNDPIGEKKGNDNQSLGESRFNKMKTAIKPSVPVNKPRMDSITLHKHDFEANHGDILQNVVRKTPGPPVSHGGGENPLLPLSTSSKILKPAMKRAKRRLMKNVENVILSENKDDQPESAVSKTVPFDTLEIDDADHQKPKPP